MSDVQNPWEDSDGQNSAANSQGDAIRVVQFQKSKTADDSFNRNGFNWGWIIVALILVWLASGFYQIQTNEQGVVLRFGKYSQTTDAGLHYHLPYPIEDVIKVSMTQERSINLGEMDAYPIEKVEKVNITQERSINLGEAAAYNASNVRGMEANNSLRSFTESHMLTGDENIVDINLTVVWKIKDAKDYLFNVRNPDGTVKVAAQSVLREIVGQSEMQPIITGDRGKVEDETKAELQKLLDDFGSGVEIVRVKLQKADPPKQVVDAFNEVQRAKADLERFKNEAEAYRNEVLPKAKGEAAQMLQDAEAYKAAVVNRAKGDADRYLSVYNAYQSGKDVTIKRMYLETMENVLKNADKVILDPSSKGANVLPYLPLSKNNNTGDVK